MEFFWGGQPSPSPSGVEPPVERWIELGGLVCERGAERTAAAREAPVALVQVFAIGDRRPDRAIGVARDAGLNGRAVLPGGVRAAVVLRAAPFGALVVHERQYCVLHGPVIGRAERLDQRRAVHFQTNGRRHGNVATKRPQRESHRRPGADRA
jgi:hypothetical protein